MWSGTLEEAGAAVQIGDTVRTGKPLLGPLPVENLGEQGQRHEDPHLGAKKEEGPGKQDDLHKFLERGRKVVPSAVEGQGGQNWERPWI